MDWVLCADNSRILRVFLVVVFPPCQKVFIAEQSQFNHNGNEGNGFLLKSSTERAINTIVTENFKLERGPTDKAKEPDPGGSDQQNLGYKQLKNRNAYRTVGLNYIYFSTIVTMDFTKDPGVTVNTTTIFDAKRCVRKGHSSCQSL